MEFESTVRGARFFDGHVPAIIKALEKIGKELERANDLKETELKLKEKEQKND